jgi:hypothetical protein
MLCVRCGADVADNRACPACGAPVPAGTEVNATRPEGEKVWTAAGAAASRLGRAAARAEERLTDPTLTDRIPGKQLAVVGYAAVIAAVLLDAAPLKHRGDLVSFGWAYFKLGRFWDVVLLLAAAAALATRVMTAEGHDNIPRAMTRPALPAAVAALVTAQAYLLLNLSLIPLLLLAAAVILVYDAVKSGLASGGVRAFRGTVDTMPNPTTTGIALVVAALLISWIPGRTQSYLGGVVVLGNDPTGTLWGLLILVGAAATIALTTSNTDDWMTHWVAGAYVLLLVAWAIVMFTLLLVPLLWLAGASIAAYDQWRRAAERTNGALRLSRLTKGPRLLVAAGVPVCLVAMSLTWRTVSSGGYFVGGYEPSYSSYYGGYAGGYNFTKYYMPGFSASNTGLSFTLSPLVVAALLALLVIAVWTTTKPVPTWAYVVPAGIVAVLALWTLVHLGDGHLGPWVFAAGLALLGTAAFTVALPAVRELSGPSPEPQT